MKRSSFRISLILLLASVFISTAVASVVEDELDVNADYKKFEYMLKDLPSSNKENLYYMLPYQAWSERDEVLFKGTELHIIESLYVKGDTKPGFKGPINFYSDKQITSKATFYYLQGDIHTPEKQICKFVPPSSQIKAKEFYECKMFQCKHNVEKKEYPLHNFSELERSWYVFDKLNSKTKIKCPFELKMLSTGKHEMNPGLLLELSDYSPSHPHGEIISYGKKFYVDLKFCSSNPKVCRFREVPFSDYEKAWINLKLAQSLKDYKLLNYLIEKLLPCVQLKDEKCIASFFKKELIIAEDVYKIAIPKITNDLIEDLKLCLDYKNLLPFGRRSRASNGKICLFSNDGKIISVTFPEVESRDLKRINYNLSHI